MRKTAPMLIAPECSAPKCHHDVDQSMMIKCRSCGQWFCEDHIVPAEDRPGERATQVPTVKLVGTGWQGVTYYLGYCATCYQERLARQPVNSSWLR